MSKEKFEVKSFIITVVIVFAVLAIFYLLTVKLTKNGTIGEEYKPTKASEAVMTYDTLNIGMIFGRTDSEYYVIFGEFEKNKDNYLESLADTYSAEEKNLPIYKVNMLTTYNKQYLSNNSNSKVNKDEDLKIKVPTLIKIKNGKNIKYIDNINKIKSELK